MKSLALVSSPECTNLLNQSQATESWPSAGEAGSLIRSLNESTKGVEVSRSEFNLLGTSYFHFRTLITDKVGRIHAGHGRAKNEIEAFVKSVNESLERLVMMDLFGSGGSGSVSGFKGILNSLEKLSHGGETKISLPTLGFRSSNGWAVGSRLQNAVRRALFEVLERDLLQRSFWTKGLAGLESYGSRLHKEYKIHFLALNTTCDLTICVVAVESSSYAGLSFGHQTIVAGSKALKAVSDSPHWIHPAIEGLQIAESYVASGGRPSSSPYDKIQFHFLNDGSIRPLLKEGLKAPKEKAAVHLPLLFDFVAIDLAETLGLSTPLYAAWATSNNILPMYIEQLLSEREKVDFQVRCDNLGIAAGPMQSPFI